LNFEQSYFVTQQAGISTKYGFYNAEMRQAGSGTTRTPDPSSSERAKDGEVYSENWAGVTMNAASTTLIPDPSGSENAKDGGLF
jgi:hypothetical protein